MYTNAKDYSVKEKDVIAFIFRGNYNNNIYVSRSIFQREMIYNYTQMSNFIMFERERKIRHYRTIGIV